MWERQGPWLLYLCRVIVLSEGGHEAEARGLIVTSVLAVIYLDKMDSISLISYRSARVASRKRD